MKLFLIILSIILSGCSFIRTDTNSDVTTPHLLHDFPQQWTTNGRISILNGKENWYAKFIWLQKNEDFELRFMGPLGETELQLTRKDQKTYLKTPSYERSSHNLEQLLLQETGWKLPLISLRYWSYGVPNPKVSNKTLYDKQGNITDLYQDGWHIQYPKRMQIGKYLLPKKIVLTEQDIKIKIIISQWVLADGS
ncbi:MAG: lipoprotein insertase outer membrane protein LolB [gamma proteobacterium symbiont of Taylorina sp.]|nr:lipoprotein insertase outer membrane protein LolB [gamma proteobacterium symbiont of Taylorina sp.]